ncbi:MAG: hypothetical protein IT503_02910 [Burkholderiaceae bacterium]|nr:hypothetical protein [Burkholderiaceae bacterium]
MAIAFVDTGAHRAAVSWYSSGCPEPAGTASALIVTRSIGIDDISLGKLLDRILSSASQGTDLIVVGHGRETGLSMRLLPTSQVRARADVISQLAADRPRPDSLFGSTPAVSPANAAAICMATEHQVEELREKMNRVRALTLTHVAFRACKMGQRPDILLAYKRFFGCKLVSAPDLRDTYGVISPGTPLQNMTLWIERHSNHRHMSVYGNTPNRIAISTAGGQSDDHSYTLDFAYESTQALTNWTRQYLGRPVAAAFPYHGQWVTNPGPNDPQIVFVGDARYNAHIRVV